MNIDDLLTSVMLPTKHQYQPTAGDTRKAAQMVHNTQRVSSTHRLCVPHPPPSYPHPHHIVGGLTSQVTRCMLAVCQALSMLSVKYLRPELTDHLIMPPSLTGGALSDAAV